MKAKDIFKEGIYFLRNRKVYRRYASQFKRYLEMRHFENKTAPGEDAYLELWHSLSKHVEPYSYRFLVIFVASHLVLFQKISGIPSLRMCCAPKSIEEFIPIRICFR